MSLTQQQAVLLLENVLFESPTQAAANASSWQSNPAATSVAGAAAAMAASGEAKIASTVVGYYLAALGRAPNAAEIHYYVAIAEQGLSQSQIAAGQVASTTWDTIGSYFAHSPEFASRGNLDFSIGNTAAYLEAVPWLYQSVLGRAPNTAEIAYYDNQVINGTDLGTLFREFTASPEFHTDTDAQIAAALASYGTAAASGQQTSPAIGAGVTLGAPPPASTPTPVPPPAAPGFGALTSGTDHIDDSAMSGAHTYQAVLGTGATLGTNDYLKGNGSATLAITDNGTGSYVMMPAAPLTLSGIATVELTTGEDAGGTSGNYFDLSTVTGLSAFHLTAAGTGLDSIEIGAGVAVTATAASSQFSLTATGAGNSLTLTDSNLSTLGVTGGFTGNIGTVDLTSTGGPTSLTLDLLGITALHFTDSNHLTSIAIEALSGTNSISAISDTALTSLSVGANSAVDFGSSGAYVALSSSLTTLDVSGDYFGNGYFDVGSATVTATFGPETSFITGSAGGTITLVGNIHSTGDVTVNGFDALIIAAHSYSSVTLTGTGASVNITDTALTTLGVDGLALTGTLTAGSTGLTLSGTSAASGIAALSDNSLTSLTATGNVVFGVSDSSKLVLGATVGSVDLSGDTDTAGTNYFQVNKNGFSISLGVDNTVLDLNGHTTAQVTTELPASAFDSAIPNLIIEGATGGFTLTLAGQTLGGDTTMLNNTTRADLMTALQSQLAPGNLIHGNDTANTYILESDDGTLNPGHAILIEIVGIHAVTVNGDSTISVS